MGRREPARLGRGGHPVEKDARDEDPAHRPRGRRAGTAASEADRARQGARREDEGRSPPRGPTGLGTGASLNRRGPNRYASRFQPPRTRRTTATRPPTTAGLTRSWNQQKPQNESTRARRQARSERQAESPARARGANASTRHDGVEPATNEETREASEGRGGRPEVRNAKRGSKSLRVAISRRVRTDENMTKRDGHEPRSDTSAPGANRDGWMMFRYSGELQLEALTADQIDPRDIAHSLAGINRFIGQTRTPMPVAWHSLVVAAACCGDGRGTELEALLHDGAEAWRRGLDPAASPPDREGRVRAARPDSGERQRMKRQSEQARRRRARRSELFKANRCLQDCGRPARCARWRSSESTSPAG